MTFLETSRLILRNVSPRDAEEMYYYRNNPVCSRYQRGQVREFEKIVGLTRLRENDMLSTEAPAFLAVADRYTDTLIGEIVVMPNMGTISLGYTFSCKHHRKGYAFEALSALMDHLHSRYPDWDYICFTDAENIPSRNLLLKLGYEDLGYLASRDSQVFGKYLREDTRKELADAMR